MRSVLLAALLSFGCSDPSNNPSSPDAQLPQPDASAEDASTPDMRLASEFGPRAIPGRWLAGDFHVHAVGASNDTGPESTPEHIKEVAVARGLDFVVLTDHSNSAGSDTTTRDEDPDLFNQGPEFPYWDKAAELSDDTFLMVDGSEISPVDDPAVDPTGHVGCYPRSLVTFNPDIAFIDRPRGTITSADTVAQARAAGCFVTVNHPFFATFWIAWDWTTRDYDAMEVFNGSAGWDQFDYFGVSGWACDQSQGRRVTAIGGSDNHRADIEPPGGFGDPALGWPATWVWSGALDWPGIVRSLDAGRVSVSDTGDPLDIDVYDTERRWLGFAGSTLSADTPVLVRVRGALHNSDGQVRVLQILRVAPDACDDRREVGKITAPQVAFDMLHEVEIGPDEAFDVHVEATFGPGEFVFGWLHPGRSDVINVHGAAVTNAVHFD